MAPSHVPLRNSCEECSTSKLKCMSAWAALDRHRCQRLTCSPGSSQKPSCVRCSKRGLLCEYKPQKRAGRRPGRSRSIVDENCSTSGSGSDTRPSPSNSRLSSVSSTAPTDTSLDLERFSADGPMDWETTLSSACPELATDYSSTLDRTHSDLSSTFDELATDVSVAPGDVDAIRDTTLTEVKFMMNNDSAKLDLDMTRATSANLGYDSSTPKAGGSYSYDADFSPDILNDLFTFAETIQNPAPPVPNMITPQVAQTAHSATEACMCMAHTLTSMRQTEQLVTATRNTSSDQATEEVLSIQRVLDVVSENKNILHAMETVLSCSCWHDGYLLTMISLIVFKVMTLYGSILSRDSAQRASDHPNFSRRLSFNPPFVDADKSTSVAAKLLVTELRHLRRVIEQLGDKLQMQIVVDHASQTSASADSGDMYHELMLPLSTTIYSQLDLNLSRRLKGLSWGIIDQISSFE
jgi:hypothetical protein